MIQKISQKKYSGIIAIPPSKSDSQRAILCSALAGGESKLLNIGKSKDELAMQKIAEQIKTKSNDSFFVGESGLAARLITAVASTFDKERVISGEGSILRRDFTFFETSLSKMGVNVNSTNGQLPISVKGPLLGGNYEVDGSESSQYISGLLMALPLAKEDSLLTVNQLKSGDYVAMTISTLKAFGVMITSQKEVDKIIYSIKGNQKYLSTDYTIDGDWSAASCWLVASALGLDISVAGLSMKSLQADKNILNAFLAAKCGIVQVNETLRIDGENRQSFEFDATNCPDLFPALAIFAALTPGTSTIKGVSRLANKESDRGIALQTELGKLGISIELANDEMIIQGASSISGGEVNSHHDHRIAMCLGIAGMFCTSQIIIQDAEVVEKSYPNFWIDLDNLI